MVCKWLGLLLHCSRVSGSDLSLGYTLFACSPCDHVPVHTPIQRVFQPHAQCFLYNLQMHCDLYQNKAVTEDGRMNNI